MQNNITNNSFKQKIRQDGKIFSYYSIKTAEKILNSDFSLLPFSLKVLLENLLRNLDGNSVTLDDIKALGLWLNDKKSDREIAFRPARVLMQDFTGVPAVVDLAAMRDAVAKLQGDPSRINPLVPVDLVIDHSLQVDKFGTKNSFAQNVALEMSRNMERYEFLRWATEAFNNFKVVPPGTGICHQVNLEYLAKVVWSKDDDGQITIYPDSVVGTDSHTTMINGLAVLGWGVGGIEAESAMLGQPVSMLIPEVIGFKITGKQRDGTTATDIVLTITQMLRARGVVGKFVEFFGEGLDYLSLADRATIANMAPEYGATCGLFPIDTETLKYLKLSNRDANLIKLVETYAKEQGMWRDKKTPDPIFTDVLTLDLADIEPCLAGPSRPQDKVLLSDAKKSFNKAFEALSTENIRARSEVTGLNNSIGHGDIAIAAITSCTNTSNPAVMIAAGLVAKKAMEFGLSVKPWVKTSLAPGSKVVTEYLSESGLQKYLDMLGFNNVGYGCTTCIGNSGPLNPEIEQHIINNKYIVCSVLSGNRNFEARVHPLVACNYLASPPLVVAYALLGSMQLDITSDPIGVDKTGRKIYLKDIWPSNAEIAQIVQKCVQPKMFATQYNDVFKGDLAWQKIAVKKSSLYDWRNDSTYIKNPPYFEGMSLQLPKLSDIKSAHILAIFGDSITTDHISPAGSIANNSPASEYLLANGVAKSDFNSYGARRGNHEVMMRGTFANTRIKNEMIPNSQGGITLFEPSGVQMSIFDAAMKYKERNTPLVVFAGKDYGMGSSRDWAAKGTYLLGVRAVIFETIERIHRSNLIGMGVLPLQFIGNMNRKSLNLDGSELIDIIGFNDNIKPRMHFECIITNSAGVKTSLDLVSCLDTDDEVNYYLNGGILHNVLRDLVAKN